MINDKRIAELYDKAAARADADPASARALGIVMITAFEFVERAEKFTGTGFENVYRTHFPMPDGGEWAFTLQRKVPE